jgi:hypothetical protein
VKPTVRLRWLPAEIKVGLSALLLTLLMGMGASMLHIYYHYERRDEQPGLTRDDLASAYHGLNAPSPLLASLERGHPEELPADARAVLISWLKGPRINEDYDNIDLDDQAPAEIIASSCLSCHSRQAPASAGGGGGGAARAIPLEYWDDIKRLAFSREIAPVPLKITAVSTHTHALSLGTMSLLLAGLAIMTSFPRWLAGGLVMFTGLALMVDIASWWGARTSVIFVDVIMVAGTIYAAGTTLLILLIFLDLWLPKKRETTP